MKAGDMCIIFSPDDSSPHVGLYDKKVLENPRNMRISRTVIANGTEVLLLDPVVVFTRMRTRPGKNEIVTPEVDGTYQFKIEKTELETYYEEEYWAQVLTVDGPLYVRCKNIRPV